MFELIVDGIPWQDSDGNTSWNENEAITLAAMLEDRMGYNAIEMIPIGRRSCSELQCFIPG